MSSLKFSYWSSPHITITSGANSSMTRRASGKWPRYTSRARAAEEAPQSLPSSSRNGAGQAAGFFMSSGMEGSSSAARIMKVQSSFGRSISGRCVQPTPRISAIPHLPFRCRVMAGPAHPRKRDVDARAQGRAVTKLPLSVLPLRARHQTVAYRRMAQRVGLQRHRPTEPHRKRGVVVIGAVGQRVYQDVEPIAVQHQPGHDVLELRRLEDHVELRDRVRAARFVAEHAGLDLELADDPVAQLCRLRLALGVVIDMGVV